MCKISLVRKRKLDICVISDAHLGTYACYADELLAYLSSIEPSTLILNGDMIDIRKFKTSCFPASHMNVINKIVSMASQGTKVYYVKGNHDYNKDSSIGLDLGNIIFCKKLILDLNGNKTCFFHGDIFDTRFLPVKWLAKLGSTGYDIVLGVNKTVNWFLKMNKKEKFSLSGKINQEFKNRAKHIANFENKVTSLALSRDYDCVVCGHIHQPKKQMVESPQGNLLYLNSGDWVDHMTSLEYSFKRWKLYSYKNDKLSPFFVDQALKNMDMNELINSIEARKVS